MNPGLRGILLAVAICVALLIWHFLSQKIPENIMQQLEAIQLYLVLGLAGICAVAAVIYIFANFFREIYTETIRKRANSLLAFAVDASGNYAFIAVDCYQSGDTTIKGYYLYLYYVIDLKNGKMPRYARKSAAREDQKALEYFRQKLGKSLSISISTGASPEYAVRSGGFDLTVSKFKMRFDFGLKVVCRQVPGGKVLWTKKI